MSSENETQVAKPRKKFKRTVMRLVVGVVLLGTIAASVVLFIKYREAVDTNPKNIEQRTIEQVTKIVEVPGEKPSVLTVLSADKLTNKELAARAADGDRLLVYAENKRIVIFRPSSGKIVDMLTIRDAESPTTLDEAAGAAPVAESAN